MSRRRGRRREGHGNEFTVWELANRLRDCKKTKNAVPKLPSGKLKADEADDFVGHLCLLEIKTSSPFKFGKRFVFVICILICLFVCILLIVQDPYIRTS